MSSTPVDLNTLPLELLEDILSYLPTRPLLRLSSVSRRIYSSVDFIARKRFRHVGLLEDHSLIFQCSSPSDRSTAPYQNCWYKGSYVTSPVSKPQQTSLGELYAHFRPLPTGTKHSQTLLPTPSIDGIHEEPKEPLDLPFLTTTLQFDASEYFTQICASSAMVKSSPEGATFSRAVQILEKESFFRIRRSWLRTASKAPGNLEAFWLDESQNVGLRLRVEESGFGFVADEDESATMFLVRYEELVVRTGHLVDLFEKAWERQCGSDTEAAAVVV